MYIVSSSYWMSQRQNTFSQAFNAFWWIASDIWTLPNYFYWYWQFVGLGSHDNHKTDYKKKVWEFYSIEIVPIIHPSGPFYNYAAANRDQERIFNSALSVISATARQAPDGVKHDCLNALEAQSIASGQEQEDTPVKSRSFRLVSVSDPSTQANLRWWMITVSLMLWMVCNKTGKLHVFSHFILSRFNYTFGPEFVKIDLIIIWCCAGGPLDRLVLRMRG